VPNAFNYAFSKFKEHWGPLVLLTLLIVVAVVAIQLVGQAIVSAATPDPTFNLETGKIEGSGGFFGVATILGLAFNALSIVLNLVIQSGIIKASLGLTRGQRPDFGTAFNGINWGQVILTALIIGAMTFVGLILCILPGILVIFFTSYALYFVIDRNLGAWDGIKASFNMVKDNLGQLVLFFLASLLAYIVGACLCGVGLLAAIPIIIIAQAYTFRTLNGDPVTV